MRGFVGSASSRTNQVNLILVLTWKPVRVDVIQGLAISEKVETLKRTHLHLVSG